MTTVDAHYMVDVDDENLLDFLAWHREAWHAGKFRGMTIYSMLKWAWMAAKNGPPAPAPVPQPLEPLPSRRTGSFYGGDVSMAVSPEGLKELVAEQFRTPVAPLTAPRPDFVQYGTITGRLPARVPESPLQTADPFAAVKLSGPQQAAMDSLYPLPKLGQDQLGTATAIPVAPRVWSGEPVRIEAPETRPMRVIPDDFELVDSFDPGNMVVGGPTEAWPRAEDG